MPRLYIHRKELQLRPAQGRRYSSGNMPSVLAQPWRISKAQYGYHAGADVSIPLQYSVPNSNNPILLRNQDSTKVLNGLWSGSRSALVQVDGKMYKLKGIAINEHMTAPSDLGKSWHVEGGELLRNVRWELKYTSMFNSRLEKEGLVSAVSPLGYYRFSCKTQSPVIGATVMQVAGDTRLDEIFYFLCFRNQDTLGQLGKEVYYNCGKIVGGLKYLLDKTGISWSDNTVRTNAHIGNVVVFEHQNEVHLGLIDFDACSDWTERSRSELRHLQKTENEMLVLTSNRNSIESICSNRISISGEFLLFMNKKDRYYLYEDLEGREFAKGFNHGYQSRGKYAHETLNSDCLDSLLENARRNIKQELEKYSKSEYSSLVAF